MALLKGSEIGAVFGFLTGTLVAIALMEPLGLSAFVFVLIGFLAGRYAETADLSAGYAPLVSAFAATLLANVLLAMAQYLLARAGAARLLPGPRARAFSHPQHAAGGASLPGRAPLAARGR